MKRIFRPSLIVGTLSLAAVIGCYWYMATRPGVNPALVPSPPTIVASFGEELRSGDLWINTLASLKRVLIGYAIGAAAALILGALAGWFRYWGYVLNPIIDALRPIPALAYIPLVIVWVGIGEPSRIIIIALAVFKPIVVNARAGMQQIAQIYVDAARTLGASRWRVFRTVALPSAVPYFIAGMRNDVRVARATHCPRPLVIAQDEKDVGTGRVFTGHGAVCAYTAGVDHTHPDAAGPRGGF